MRHAEWEAENAAGGAEEQGRGGAKGLRIGGGTANGGPVWPMVARKPAFLTYRNQGVSLSVEVRGPWRARRFPLRWTRTP